MPPSPESEDRGLPAARPDSADPPSRTNRQDPVLPPSEAEASASSSQAAPQITVDEYPAEWDDSGGGPPSPPYRDDDPTGGEPPEFSKMSFLDHLEELRRRLIRSIIAIGLAFGICWWQSDRLFGWLAGPIVQVLKDLGMDDHLVVTSPTEAFTVYVQLSMVAGIFLASGYIIQQLWGFISPGLYPHEKRYAFPFITLCTLLFVGGGAFAYFVAFPGALRFLISFGSRFRPMITVKEYFSLAVTIILGMALVFELPVLILFLTLLRLVTPGFLWRNTRYATLIIFIAAAAITPTPDVPTMMLFAMPLLGLYFLGIGLSYLVVRMRGRRV